MKKIILFLFIVIFFSGCKASNEYNGKVTDSSKQYLDKGYIINVYRDTVSLGEDADNYGKGYIRMTFNVITDYYSTHDYSKDADYNIKKKIVSNVKVIKTPNMGIADELYGNFTMYDKGISLLGTNNKFETVYDYPHTSGVQSSIAVVVNKIALFDSSKYEYGVQPSLEQVYRDLGVTRNSVSLTLGFRVELVTKDNKTFYKDYEIEMPSNDFDISGDEFQSIFTVEDVNKMEPFLEK